MDRFWIAREAKGQNKIALPGVEDIAKYSQALKDPVKPQKDPFQQKAELCAQIINLKNPGLDAKRLASMASVYMNKSMTELMVLKKGLELCGKNRS